MKWISFARATCGFTQLIDLAGQKRAAAIKEIGREKPGSTRHKRATIVRHPRKLTNSEGGAITRKGRNKAIAPYRNAAAVGRNRFITPFLPRRIHRLRRSRPPRPPETARPPRRGETMRTANRARA